MKDLVSLESESGTSFVCVWGKRVPLTLFRGYRSTCSESTFEMTLHRWIISLTVVTFQKFNGHCSHVYRADGNYIRMRTTWKWRSFLGWELLLSSFSISSWSQLAVSGFWLVVIYSGFLKKEEKKKAWQLLCVTVTFPSSCLTCIRCTVAHYPESWWCEAGLLFLKRRAGRNGNRRKSFLKVSHLCHFKKKKNLFWICGCQVIFLITVICHGSAI